MADSSTSHSVLRSLVLPIYLPMIFLSMGMSAPVPAFPQYLAGLGAAIATVGFVVSLKGFGHLIADVPGGLVVQRLGVRRVVLYCFALSGSSATIIAATNVLWVIGLAKTVMGFANAVIALGIMAYVRQTVASAYRGRALSFAGGSMRIGVLVGPVVGGFLAEARGVPATFAFQAATTAIGFALVLFGMKHVPGSAESISKGERRSVVAGLADTISRLREGLAGQGFKLSTVGFSIFTLMLLRAARDIIMPLWGDALGMSAAAIGQIMSASAAVELLVVVPAGLIMDRAGRKAAASLCIGVFSLGVILLPLSEGLLGFLVFAMIIGIGNGFGSGINMTIGTDLAPDQAIGEFLGLWRLFGDVGGALGPVIVGAVAGAVTLPVALLTTGGIGLVGMAVMALVAPETKEAPTAAPR